jgi:asparagine synthase (glutamine-hydrolysing)
MCGIAGTVGSPGPDPRALRAMAGAMVHRGPDGEGTWHDDRAGLAFRRLAIIDLHERSSQPLHLGPLHLVFNGEIYNYVELREELRGAGHDFVTEGDGEVLLHAWAQWGEGALDRLNGMFALALWDDAHGRLTLATDPFAEKPLFHVRTAAGLAFASDVRALRALDPALGAPDQTALGDFVAIGAMPALPATFFGSVSRLPGAHLATWQDGDLRVRRYWDPRRVAVPHSVDDAAAELRRRMTESVRLRLRSDVAVGTSLSGGVDSAVIAALVGDLAPEGARHAFTATFAGFERDEWGYAQEIAEAARVQRHHAVRPAGAELLDDLTLLVRDQEEPFPGTSIYAQWRVMRAAREAGVTVMLDGQGADELFAGYPMVFGEALAASGPRAVARALRRAPRSTAAELATALGTAYGPRALARWHRRRALASPYAAGGLVEAAAARADPPPEIWPADGDLLRRQLLRQAFRTVLPDLLRFADRDSMAHSVEVRLPFLDRAVAEFAWSLPPRLLHADGVSKALLRHAFRGTVPDAVLDRRDKVGYETPQARWFGEPAARARVGEVLLDPSARGRGWYDPAALERDVRDGWRDVGAMWRALNAELWLREHTVGGPSADGASMTAPAGAHAGETA